MKTSVIKAIQLILSMDAELLDILGVTAQMSLQSSVLALLIGLPIGILLGSCKFPGRSVLLVEAGGALGGVGTSGLVPAFAPFGDGVHILADAGDHRRRSPLREDFGFRLLRMADAVVETSPVESVRTAVGMAARAALPLLEAGVSVVVDVEVASWNDYRDFTAVDVGSPDGVRFELHIDEAVGYRLHEQVC